MLFNLCLSLYRENDVDEPITSLMKKNGQVRDGTTAKHHLV